MERLTEAEGERVLTVLTTALENAHLLARVPEPGAADVGFAHELEERESYELAEALLSQWQVEESASVLLGGPTDGGSRPEGAASTAPDALAIAKRVREGAKHLCRELRNDGEAVEALAERNEPSDGMLQLLAALDALRDLTADRLRQSHEESKLQTMEADAVASRHHENLEARQELEAELEAQRERNRIEREAVDEVLNKLETDVAELRKRLANEAKSLETNTKSSREKIASDHRSLTERLRAEERALRAEIAKSREERSEQEKLLRRRVLKLETEVATLVTKYDGRMLELDAEILRLRTLYEDEKKRLAELTYHFDRLEADQHRADEEDRIYREERRKSLEGKMMVWNFNVTNIQRVYRGFFTRTHLNDFVPKKKKGKKGKKGKKKR
uniref:Dynein regulatory complex protein 10 n=1 Tax=Bicosoecida sp. CB-2014 TaxID=1486930 RepID=A0A7S1C788_9STRA|mmetsp:Transcript_16286/g.56935  ORF Transcript_16286/g.56935 Transcript_16286/m.56935 type:complete len:389 (+) Transcript_16286:253-1419(+)|eukprot:CAMPEP_0203817410 /NCGR_PEP_ID=MMETSP0115-20131106/25320_1 /ASSEMBLY_ACC=CAM_ASM_000227 /TAXON_ID=33651 /ORGANISM="Bicosoecid sp, Strain ms1" /LENGTH=388 /DNA_ID=CAMNT_0050726339 /DNA_START=203 /DNA_END=1369 /DNA_ORIENTATION=+